MTARRGVGGREKELAARRRTAADADEGRVPAHGSSAGRKPEWLKVAVPPAREFRATAGLLDELHLHTVCSEARCPNKGECFAAGTATFLILGDRCTRDCRFCSVRYGEPAPVDADEPRRLAAAAVQLGLQHVVVTSVSRDDLSDGGAGQFAAVIGELRRALPSATVEVLTPDFRGDRSSLATVLEARPDVFNHNLETVPRLYPAVRPSADYRRSLRVLAAASERVAGPAVCRGSAASHGTGVTPVVKTGLMLGLGETDDEVRTVLEEAREAGVDIVTIGQYLRPAAGCSPVVRYVPPAEFLQWIEVGSSLDLAVVAGPFVRSSYRAGEALRDVVGEGSRR